MQMSKIDSGTFSQCSSLRKIALPEGLASIEGSTFWKCVSLQEIYIPATVKTVGGSAFYACKSLNKVYFGGSEDLWNQVVIVDDYDHGNKYLTTDIMNRYWNQTAASIGY